MTASLIEVKQSESNKFNQKKLSKYSPRSNCSVIAETRKGPYQQISVLLLNPFGKKSVRKLRMEQTIAFTSDRTERCEVPSWEAGTAPTSSRYERTTSCAEFGDCVIKSREVGCPILLSHRRFLLTYIHTNYCRILKIMPCRMDTVKLTYHLKR